MAKGSVPEVNVDEIMRKIREEVARRGTAAHAHDVKKTAWRAAALNIRVPDIPDAGETAIWRFVKKVQFRLQKYPGYPFIYGMAMRFKKFVPQHRTVIRLCDLNTYHDEEFISNAYRVILKREPDAGGFNNYLAKLRTGRLSKTEVIGRIRFSKEGRQRRGNIKGLAPRFLILSSFRIPVLGYLLNLAAAVLRLPAILRNVHEYEAFTSARFTRQRRDLDDAFAKAEQNLNRGMDTLKSKVDAQNLREQLALKTDIEYIKTLLSRKADSEAVSQQLSTLSGELARKADAGELAKKADSETVSEGLARKADSEAVSQQLSALSEKIARKADVGELSNKADAEAVSEGLARKADSEAVSQQLSALSEKIARKADADTMNNRLKSKADAEIVDGQLAGLHKEIAKKENIPVKDHALDAMYAAFEDRFRGTRNDIKERLKAYLPYVEKLKKDKPLLDLGSGRGEWLELMKEHGYQARGVDANRVMVRQCTERGLDAVESDALEYLRNQRKESFSAVSGFHIVEHLPLKILVMLIDESLRVLRPGGMVIFETPNPENITVGATSFYIDPTHMRPLPPTTLQFIAEERGFASTKILTLHPFPRDFKLSGSKTAERFNEHFYGPRDYAMVGYKA